MCNEIWFIIITVFNLKGNKKVPVDEKDPAPDSVMSK